MEYTFIDFLGNLGVSLIIVSYFLLQINKIAYDGFLYSFVNMTGAIMIIFSLLENFNLSAMIIEVFWAAISFLGIIKYSKKNLLGKNK